MSSTADIPPAGQLTPLVLRAIEAGSGQATNQQITEFVTQTLGLSAERIAELHDPVLGKGRTELEYRLAWSRTRLRQQGKIVRRTAGVWALAGHS